MVDKVTLAALVNLENDTTAVSVINSNSAAITTAMDNTLSRDGTSPNQMAAQLDMNSNRIINLPAPASATEPTRIQDLEDAVASLNSTVSVIPGGAVGSIQFNSAFTFTGDSNLYWDNTGKRLSLGTSSPDAGAKLTISGGSVSLNATNPTYQGINPVYAAPSSTSDYTLLTANAVYNSSALALGHAIEGFVVVDTGAPISGSARGLVGGVYNKVTGVDAIGVLGEINNSAVPTTSLGAALVGLVSGYAIGGNQDVGVDAIQATSFTNTGNHPQNGLKVTSSLASGNAFKQGVYIQGATDYGLLIGGDTVGPIPTNYIKVFDTSNNTVLALTSAGSLQIGTNSLLLNAKGFVVKSTGEFTSVTNSSVTSTMVRLSSDGGILNFSRDGSTLVGSVSVSTTATAYNTTSDLRRKKSFRNIEAGSIIDSLRPVQFQWISNDQTDYGLVAQEAYKVFPEAVTVGGDDPDKEPWMVDYLKFIPLLLSEIKSLRSRVASLESK